MNLNIACSSDSQWQYSLFKKNTQYILLSPGECFEGSEGQDRAFFHRSLGPWVWRSESLQSGSFDGVGLQLSWSDIDWHLGRTHASVLNVNTWLDPNGYIPRSLDGVLTNFNIRLLLCYIFQPPAVAMFRFI
jgi:hypothetical protein